MNTKFLIVDDTRFMRTMLTDILQKQDFEVVGEADNGLKAIQLYRELMPDVVFMDISMPEMDGIEAMLKIREINPKAVVIICSGISQQYLISDAMKMGANGYVMKPFKPKQIREVVQKYALHKVSEARSVSDALAKMAAAKESAQAEAKAKSAAAEPAEAAPSEPAAVEPVEEAPIEPAAAEPEVEAPVEPVTVEQAEETPLEPAAVEPVEANTIEPAVIEPAAEETPIEPAVVAPPEAAPPEPAAAEPLMEPVAMQVDASEESLALPLLEMQPSEEADSLEGGFAEDEVSLQEEAEAISPDAADLAEPGEPIFDRDDAIGHLPEIFVMDSDDTGPDEPPSFLGDHEFDQEEDHDAAGSVRFVADIIPLHQYKNSDRNKEESCMKEFTSSISCRWKEDIEGREVHYAVVCYEGDNYVQIEISGQKDGPAVMSFEGLRNLLGWIDAKVKPVTVPAKETVRNG